MSVRRILTGAAILAALFAGTAAPASAEPLPCPTVDGEGFCYDVTVDLDLPDVSSGDLTVAVTVSVTNDCAAAGCPVNKSCISIPCTPIRIVFADRVVSTGRTGVDLGGSSVTWTTTQVAYVPRVCADDEPGSPCVGGFPVTVSTPTVSGTIATVWVLGTAIPVG